MKKLDSALKADGVLCIGLQRGASAELELDEPLKPGHKIFLNIFSKEEVHSLLQNYGFQIIYEFERPSENAAEFNFTKYCVIVRKSSRLKI